MNDKSELEALIKLRDRFLRERLQAIHQLAAVAPTSAFPEHTLKSLTMIQAAAAGTDAEIAMHTPTLGHGAEQRWQIARDFAFGTKSEGAPSRPIR